MSVIENLDVNLRGKIGDLQTKLQTAGKNVQQFKDQVVSHGNIAAKGFQSSVSTMGMMAAKYLGPLALAAGVGWGVKLAADAEKAQVGFTTMLGSADKAKALLGELKTFGASTPFEFPELRQSAQSLLSFGVPLGDVMTRLKTLGDVAAGSGSDIKDLSLIFGKTLAKGKFELEQGNQLAERGIPIYSTLAKQLGVGQAELMKMISAGKVSAGAVQTAFESMSASGGIFDNAMNKQSQTLLGMWSTLIDNITSTATSVGQFFIEAFGLKDILAGFINFSGNITTTMEGLMPVATAIKGVYVASFNAIGTAMQFLGALFQPILGPIVDWLANTFGGSVSSVATTCVGAYGAIANAITNFSSLMKSGMDSTWMTNLVANITGGVTIISAVLSGFYGVAVASLSAVAGVAVASFNAIGAGLQWLGSMFMPILSPIVDWLANTFGGTVASFAETCLVTFATIEFAINNFSRIWSIAFDTVWLKVLTFGNDIKNIFTSVIPAIWNNFGEATYTFFANLANNIGSIVKEIWNYIRSGGADAIEIQWKPLIMDEIVSSFHREMTDAEKALADGLAIKKDTFQQDLGKFVNDKVDAFKKVGVEEKAKLEGTVPTEPEKVSGDIKTPDQPAEQKSKKDQAAKALEKGSAATVSAINGMNKNNDPTTKAIEKGNALAKENNKSLRAIEKNTQGGLAAAPL